ncbi:MAG: sugar ABC transporter permease [Spirochaetaceae bacterium]|nr:MAG: sugar ABC transporter permease [Spirochaetaceae bacterium]
MQALRRYKWAIAFFVGPAAILYTYFVIVPIFASFSYSLTRWDAISEPIFIGMQNYRRFAADVNFSLVMSNTLKGLFWSLVIQVSFGLAFAYLIYRTRVGFRVYRALVFLPVVLSAAAVALMFTLVFNADVGAVNAALRAVGLGGLTRNWLSDTRVVYYTVLTPMIYQFVGLYVVILLAGMMSIPEEVIESSTIDGAGSFRTFFSIVIPMQSDIIFVCVVMITTGLMTAFEHSYIMTWGGPGSHSAFLGVYMYFRTFIEARFGFGAAVAMVILFGSLFFTLIFQRISKRFDY